MFVKVNKAAIHPLTIPIKVNTTMKLLKNLAGRLYILVLMLTYWLFLLAALPFAWTTAHSQLGWTTLDQWKHGWKLYAPTALKDGIVFIFGRQS